MIRAAPSLAAVAAVTCPLLALAQEPPDAGGVTAEIRASEARLAQAMHDRDRQQLEALLAPEYVLRSSPDIDRSTWIANAVSLCWGSRSDIDRFDAREVGDAVVASFELTFYVDPSTCQPATLRSLITDVWTRQPDGWRLLVRHSGAAPDAAAGVAAQFGAVPLPPPVWTLTSELSFVATGGNTSTRTLGLGGAIVHRSDRTTTRGTVSFITSETDGITGAESIAAQGRHSVALSGRLDAFGEGLYSRDRFAGIDSRVEANGGLAYTTRLPRPQSLALEGGFGYTVEDRIDTAELRFATGTTTIRYGWQITPGAELTETLGVVADLEAADNWRGNSATALTVALNRVLSLRAAHVFEYRNRPVEGFGRTDTRTSAALVFSLERRP